MGPPGDPAMGPADMGGDPAMGPDGDMGPPPGEQWDQPTWVVIQWDQPDR